MDTSKDYYAILGVLPTAEDAVIRAAYRALAQLYHPDRFSGTSEEAHRRMSEINEAYSILSDPEKRKKYDDMHDSNTLRGDSYFNGNNDDTPPQYDPLERDWAVALKYYPDLKQLESKLLKISWRLAYSFRANLLDGKQFENRKSVADTIEAKFFELYFGTNAKLVVFARELIEDENRQGAKALNEVVRVLGSNIDPDRVIAQIRREFPPRKLTNSELMEKLGVSFDGESYRYKQYRYEKLADALSYAKLQQSRVSKVKLKRG
jgi:DnaJ-class molecular chaperone